MNIFYVPSDNSDEDHCSINCGTAEGKFLCHDNFTCIAIEQTCNKKPDCPDQSDEKEFCDVKDACQSVKCNGGFCHPLPSGAECVCQKGFKFDTKSKECVVRIFDVKF